MEEFCMNKYNGKEFATGEIFDVSKNSIFSDELTSSNIFKYKIGYSQPMMDKRICTE